MKLLKLDQGQYTIHAICDKRGNADLLEFLEGLGANLQSSGAAMLRLLERCAQHGPPKNSDLKHNLSDGIYELRKGQLRVLYFTDKGRLIICSHGLIKKTGKVPKKDIDRVKKARNRYLDAQRRDLLEILEEDDHG